MHLKTLSLVGFKSFADKTRIECEPGVTVVVGPNGSGKSNLVDAIAWVMGTQATSTLRTSKMEDVIFAGTAVRPALGRSEVSLTLDNAAGGLAVDLAEVTITRRLFRDGTSEYEINGTGCRLLDIQELLADSGVGRHQHVIVGQGRVDAVLNAGPEEHRAVIEEAAGVVKHRARRDRSIRRLEATEMDVQRLKDLLDEQEKRMRPLKRQAKAAEQHDQVRDEWRAVRLWVGGERLRSVRSRLGEIEYETVSGQKQLDAALAEREQIVAALPGLQAAAGETGEALDRDTQAAARLDTTAERLHSIALVARERRLHLERSRTGEAGRRDEMVAEADDLKRRIANAATEHAAASEAAERAEMALRGLEDEERSLAEADRLPAEGLAASLRGDMSALEAAEVRDRRESDDLARRRGAVAAVIEEEVVESNRLVAEIESIGHERDKAEAALTAARDAAGRDRDAARVAEEAHHVAETAHAGARARLETLESAGSGLADPETRERAASLDGMIGPVTARLDVPARLARAVDATLGSWSDSFVAGAFDTVVAAARTMKGERRGGVAFVTASGAGEVPARAVSGATALVDVLGAGCDRLLAAMLLGDVVLCDDWDQALAIVAEHPVRVVTTEGDLITPSGIVAAHPEGAGPVAIEAAAKAAERAATDAARAASRRTTAMRARDAAESKEREAAQALESIERTLGGLRETVRLLDRSRAERTAELDRLDARARALAEAAARRVERMADLRERIASLDDSGDQLAWDDLSKRRDSVSRRRDAARRAREESAAALAAVVERKSLLEARLAEIAASLEDEASTSDAGAEERLELAETAARRALESVRRHAEALRDRQRALRREAGEAGVRLEKARARREELGQVVEAAREALSGVAVEAAELKVRAESIAEALRRDADAEEDEALAAARPDIPEGVEAADHAEALAARLRRLGPVNPLAAAEYRELEERVAFVRGQLEDLEESRTELRKVIRALDEEIGRLFREAFADIAEKFSENFSLLFPGGTGRITLTQPDDVLETGVEIHAQPMGKKVGRLQLLSGGERSLAALAFLFAVFRSRPSPFYVLDEVEAALDDANLRRFLRLVETLRDTSQLVIVTHQQQTMEAADILYGVTMEPGESSRVLAKRLVRA